MNLPLIVSIPHGGLEVPSEVADLQMLNADQVRVDGDEGAAEIYALEGSVRHVLRTSVARAFVDLNRPPNDRGRDGVVKTHTIFEEPIYRRPLSEGEAQRLIERYWQPYQAELRRLAADPAIRLGIDGHTMAAIGPPIARDAGQRRPRVCLGDGGGAFPEAWKDSLTRHFRDQFGDDVVWNEPFRGGYITREMGSVKPWLQIELARTESPAYSQQRDSLEAALRGWCGEVF
jgi:formiminoglutamase